MNEYIVTFSISTTLASLEDLTKQLGEAGSGSHTVGTTESGEYWEETVWKIESLAEKKAPLVEHVESLWEQIPWVKLGSASLPADQLRVLDIAAFFDDASCQINISTDWLDEFARNNINLEISCYPCDFRTNNSA